MKKRILGIFVCMLLIITILPMTGTVMAGDEENPEIEDEAGDALGYLDVLSAWFYENPDEPNYLYAAIKLRKPSSVIPLQSLIIRWKFNGEIFASALFIGLGIPWLDFKVGHVHNNIIDETIISGSFNKSKNFILCKIPKSAIGDPQPGDILTNTRSHCFSCLFGFNEQFFKNIAFLRLYDHAPDDGYGKDYIIQY